MGIDLKIMYLVFWRKSNMLDKGTEPVKSTDTKVDTHSHISLI